MTRAIRADREHRISPVGSDYGSLERQNMMFSELGISPTSKGDGREYNPKKDSSLEIIGDYEDKEVMVRESDC
jgi:hypothetical protein